MLALPKGWRPNRTTSSQQATTHGFAVVCSVAERIEIELRLVEDGEIERTPRGKVRFVVSQVPAADKLGHD